MNVSSTYEACTHPFFVPSTYPPYLSSPNYFKLQPPNDDSAARDAGGFFARIDPSDFGHFDPDNFGTDDDASSFDNLADEAASSFANDRDPSDYYAYNKKEEQEQLVEVMKSTAPEAEVAVKRDENGVTTSKKYAGPALREIPVL